MSRVQTDYSGRMQPNGTELLSRIPQGNVSTEAKYVARCGPCGEKYQTTEAQFSRHQDPLCPRCYGALEAAGGRPKPADGPLRSGMTLGSVTILGRHSRRGRRQYYDVSCSACGREDVVTDEANIRLGTHYDCDGGQP